MPGLTGPPRRRGPGRLDEAEVREPEFGDPVHISGPETASKLEALGRDAFFDSPRTVAETVSQLRECGWVASPLEVSKTLTRMAIRRELTRDSQDRLNYYRRGGGPIGSPVQARTPGTS